MLHVVMDHNNPKMLETGNFLTLLIAHVELNFTCTKQICFDCIRLWWISLVFLAVTPNKFADHRANPYIPKLITNKQEK